MLRIIITAVYFALGHAFHGVAGHGQEAVATWCGVRHCICGQEYRCCGS